MKDLQKLTREVYLEAFVAQTILFLI